MVNLYAQNIREQFGFHIKPKTIQFDQHPLITHMQSMFPKCTDNYQSFNYMGINEEINQNEEPDLDEPDRHGDINEIPKKIRRISDECIASSSNSIRSISMFDKKHDPSKIGLKELDESIELMKKFRVFVMNSANTVQVSQNELENLKVSHADVQRKNDQLNSQLNSVCAERDQANSDAKKEIEKLKEDHARAIALIKDMKKIHADGQTKSDELLSDATSKIAKVEAEYAAASKEVAAAKAKIKQLKKDRECLRKGLSNSHNTMNELQAKLETNHKLELNELRQELQTKLESEKNKADSIIKEKVNFEKKCEQIVNNVKAETRKCKGCGDVKRDLFCSSLCCSVYGNVQKLK